MSFLLEPLSYEFMQRGLLASVTVGILCAVMGTYVVLRGMAFLGDALAHAVALRRVELREQLRPLLLDRECLSHDGSLRRPTSLSVFPKTVYKKFRHKRVSARSFGTACRRRRGAARGRAGIDRL